jgi:beta-xylosidase
LCRNFRDEFKGEPVIDAESLPTWQDATRSAEERAAALIAEMTLEEKVAQLVGVWVGASADGGEVAPHQNDLNPDPDLDAILPNGLGQLTRPFGTRPVDPAVGALSLQRTQERIVAENRFGIPAVAHEECLAGFAAWGATAYPVPLSWGAAFDPGAVREMAARIGADLRRVGVHQGLAPVLDVVRDARWGRVEETIGEDPYLVGTIGAAYVAGLESTGVVATLKHFAGYSASKAGRNFGPVSVGPRERADVLLVPFEMALRDGGARSVMHAYTDTDGVPSAADAALLTGILRDRWGFTGTVVADYFGVAFLHLLHGVAADLGEAAALALAAGVDVELPTVHAFADGLIARIRDGATDEALVDRALDRVLRQKAELGLLDAGWSPVPPVLAEHAGGAEDVRGRVDLDPEGNRALAATIAERAVVLLANDGTLPLAAPARIAVVGPNAEQWTGLLGCYSFPAHVGVQHPEVPLGIALPTPLEAIRAEFPDAAVTVATGTGIDDFDVAGVPAAVDAAREADVALVVLGDRAGLFGRGTSGEGCDVESLVLPGAQQQLLDAVLATGTPTVVVLLTGRPYALGGAAGRAAAIVQAFFPGEEGSAAIAGVLSGRVNPSGRLPVSVPASPGTQPTTYLGGKLSGRGDVSSVDPTPAFPFGHGLGYSAFEWTDATAPQEAAIGGDVEVAVSVRNASERGGAEVVQVYLSDPVATVVRPVKRLVGFARVELAAGAAARVTFRLPTDLASFVGIGGRRVLEPGRIDLHVAASSADSRAVLPVELVGDALEYDDAADASRALSTAVRVDPLG